MKKLFYLMVITAMAFGLKAQTLILDPTGDGGFENGSDFTSNGWTVVNADTNKWFVGTAAFKSGSNGAYISNDGGTSNIYTVTLTTGVQVSHFYRDVTIPPGTDKYILSFDFKGLGESTFDYMRVYLTSTTTTPIKNQLLTVGGSIVQINNSTTLNNINLQSNWTRFSFPLAVTGGTTYRLIFTWRNDNTTGNQGPAAVDNIKIIGYPNLALAGSYDVNTSLPSSSSNFESLGEAVTLVNAVGVSAATTFNLPAGTTYRERFDELTATGTASNTITFQKSGAGVNPTVTWDGTSYGTDWIFKIIGGDYITLDGINFTGSAFPAGNLTGVEYGVHVASASATNGCQNNTFRNLNIDLNVKTTTQNITGSRGIYFNQPTSATAFSGTNSNNLIKNISVQNAYRSIDLAGITAFRDTGNVITADPTYQSPLSGSTTGYNDLGNTTISQTSGMRTIEVNGQSGLIISKCEIRNTQNTSTSSTNDHVGILLNSTGTHLRIEIFDNLIHDLINASTSTAVVYGIWQNSAVGTGPFYIYRNKIYKLSLASTSSGTVRGMLIMGSASSNQYIFNNFIYQLENPASTQTGTAATCLRAIELNSAYNVYLYYNTLYLDASYTGLSSNHFQTGCLYISSSTNMVLDMKNNIFINKSSTATTGTQTRAVAVYKTTSVIGTQITNATNNNILYAGTPGTKNLLYYAGGGAGTGAQDIPTYQSNSANGINNGGGSRETNAKTENVPFVSTSGTYDLHINPSLPTYAEGNGLVIAGFGTDIDGDTRSGSTPDIGADEGTFTPKYANDIAASAFITPTSGSTILAGSSFSPQAKFTNTGTSAQTNIPVRYKIYGPAPAYPLVYEDSLIIATLNADAEVISTFSSTSLLAGNYIIRAFAELPGDGFNANDSISGTVAAAGPLSGDYVVGSSQPAPFNTITNAFARLSFVGVSGPVRFLLDDATYSAGETFPLSLAAFTGASATNTFTLKPNTGKTVLISGSNTTSILTLNGADFVIIDGSNTDGGTTRDLTFRNTNTTGGVIVFQNDASDNTLKNTIVEGSTTGTTTAAVFVAGGTTTGNENVTINNCAVRDRSDAAGAPAYGIYCFTSTANNSNLVISNNEIFNFTNTGIFISETGSDGITISGNDIYTTSPRSTALTGINFGTATTTANTITQNKIRDLSSSSTGSHYAISLLNARNTLVSRNRIYNLPTAGTLHGIYYGGKSGGTPDVTIVNNQISIVTSGTSQTIYGIRDFGYTGNTISGYFNSVYVGGTATGTATWAYQRGTGTPTTSTLKNNIFFNNRTGGSVNHFALGDQSNGSGTFVVSNNFYAGTGTTPANFMDRGTNSSGTPESFSAWVTAKNDKYSYGSVASGVNPANMFTDITLGNLNINTANSEALYVMGKATQIASVSNDFEGDPRSTTVVGGSPDLGSDEFTSSATAPNAFSTGTYTVGDSIVFSVLGKVIGWVKWTNGTDLPSDLTLKYYSGTNHPDAGTGNFGNTYYSITPTGGTDFEYSIVLYYDPAQLGTVPFESNLKLAKWNGVSWVNYSTSVVDSINKTLAMTGLTSFSEFTLNDDNNPLPVTLKSVSAVVKDRNVVINWKTETEVNLSKYIIERKSADDKSALSSWVSVGEKNGSGNSNSPKEYSFTDTKLNTGKYVYRIKMVDNDGTFEYSPEVKAEVGKPSVYDLKQNYPNSFNPSTKIEYQLANSADVRIDLYSITGQLVQTLVNETAEAGYYVYLFDANRINNGLASGIYIYRMTATDKITGEKFISTKKMNFMK